MLLQKMLVGQRIKEYFFQERLGSGSFGEVWLVKNTKTGDYAAMKLFDSYNENAISDYESEVNAYKVLSNRPECDPYIVCMYNNGSFDRYYYIVQELMSGDLGDFSKGTKSKYQIQNALSLLLLMYQSAEGLRHIHESGMVHSDIKPWNILYHVPEVNVLDASYFNNPENMRYNICIKYGDPGLACTLPREKGKSHTVSPDGGSFGESQKCIVPGTQRSSHVPDLQGVSTCVFGGTQDYMAPEFYSAGVGKSNYPNTLEAFQANDIWGLGLVFRSIIEGWKRIQGFNFIRNQGEIPPVHFISGDPFLDEAINDIINLGMVVYDYKLRLTAAELVVYINDVLEKALGMVEEDLSSNLAELPLFVENK